MFLKEGRIVPHESISLDRADSVSATFEMQKKDEKFDTKTLLSSNDILLCPVRSWAAIVKRIRSYRGTNDDTQVSAYWSNGRIDHVTSKHMINAMEDAVEAVGRERLNIEKGEIGTHSLRSGAAMSMFLGGVDTERIKMIGRWNSYCFIRYIRKQVEQFSQDVSKKMIIHKFHRHIPSVTHRNQQK